jgi:hypothetical protein
MKSPSYAQVLDGLGEQGPRLDGVPAVLAAEAFSQRELTRARTALSRLPETQAPGMSAIAFGSLGRMEASPQSDLDLAFLFDGNVVDRGRATRVRTRCVEALAGTFDIPEKTFDEAIDVRDLIRHVGGAHDSHSALTYRALLLTEGAWLHNPSACHDMKQIVFSVYAQGLITRGRFLASLANDLHRYYRTLCVDYRFKVEEQTKSWAIRVLKLRHTRKLWHLANICLQCWAVDAADERRDAFLAERLGWPPLVRISRAMQHFGAPETCGPVWIAHDRFLESMGSPIVRGELQTLDYGERERSDIYLSLHRNAYAVDDAASAVLEVLWARSRTFLTRFCIL